MKVYLRALCTLFFLVVGGCDNYSDNAEGNACEQIESFENARFTEIVKTERSDSNCPVIQVSDLNQDMMSGGDSENCTDPEYTAEDELCYYQSVCKNMDSEGIETITSLTLSTSLEGEISGEVEVEVSEVGLYCHYLIEAEAQ